jgi:asparagine synthase (glutamine-hydrolysing)
VKIEIHLDEVRGWRRFESGRLALWFKGYLNEGSPPQLVDRLEILAAVDWLDEVLLLDGHFALVVSRGSETLAAVDRIASIPLFYGGDEKTLSIGSNALWLKEKLGLETVNAEAALEFGMSGFTTGPKTLYEGLEALGAGEAVFFQNGAVERQRYALYHPKPEGDGDDPALVQGLAQVTLGIFKKMVRGLDGRPVLIPLSAGLDSRLVAAALKELAYENVKCFSYGRRGNHEARGAKAVAEKLGYPWVFVEHTSGQQATTFASEEMRQFMGFADALNAVPFQQDFFAVGRLKESGYASPDAVFVNGQSGDFISGNHIPAAFAASLGIDDEETRWARILDALLAKHFDLWQVLRTPENLADARAALRGEIESLTGGLGNPADDSGLYEMSELLNRQVKYVIAGQRTYEWYGFDWRLPLWDNAYLDFWEGVPLTAKLGQNLFRKMLGETNWGGVWGEEWQFPKTIMPAWVRPLRFAAKALHAPLGRARWHRFEKNYIKWPTETVCNYAVASYGRVACDRRGHRNAISWHTEAYLRAKGLGFDGAALEKKP